MKKLSLVLMLMMLVSISACAALTNDASVVKVTGEAVLISEGASRPVREGMVLREGDVIRTQDGASVDLTVAETAGVRVRAQTECQIGTIHAPVLEIKLNRGDAAFNIDKLPPTSTFQVRTPSAIAAVRGTQLSGHTDEEGSDFTVRDGEVDVTDIDSNKTVRVREGETATVSEDGDVSVREATGSELLGIEDVSSVQTCS